jgi:hypothetical protein
MVNYFCMLGFNQHSTKGAAMSKSHDVKKDSKKQAQKSLKEKRAEKRAKKLGIPAAI